MEFEGEEFESERGDDKYYREQNEDIARGIEFTSTNTDYLMDVLNANYHNWSPGDTEVDGYDPSRHGEPF